MNCPSCGRPDGDTHHGANKRHKSFNFALFLITGKDAADIGETYKEISEREHVCWLCGSWFKGISCNLPLSLDYLFPHPIDLNSRFKIFPDAHLMRS